jgi:quercetin dioxygenase-like cupin family protein
MSEHMLPETVALTETADALLADLPHHAAGRTARTVVSGPLMRAVVLALRDGVEMAEHDAPAAATLFCIRGRVTLRTQDDEWTLDAGELVPVPAQRHAVVAHADSAVLLTVALRPA